MILDHLMYKEGCTLFLLMLIAPYIGDREAQSSTVEGLSWGHKLMRVDLLESMSFSYTQEW